MTDQNLSPLATSVPILDGQPRLSHIAGRNLTYLKLVINHDVIQVLPDIKKYRQLLILMAILSVLSFALAIGVFLSNFSNFIAEPHLIGSIILYLGVFFLITSVVVNQVKKRVMREGPVVSYSQKTQQIQVPRYSVTLDKASLVRWDLVSGCWHRAAGKYDEPSHFDMSNELQLVFRVQDKLFALPIIRDQMLKPVQKYTSQLAEFTHLPWERVIEPTNWWKNPYPPKK